jgi:hypothetical protein
MSLSSSKRPFHRHPIIGMSALGLDIHVVSARRDRKITP